MLILGWALAAGVWPGAASAAACDGYEPAFVRWIVPSRPGGGYDAYSRLLQPFLEQRLATRVRIENRPEAGGLVAANRIRDARPDGTTLGLLNASGLLAAHLAGRGAVPDPAVDFTPLARVVTNRMMLYTGRDSGISDIDDLVRTAIDRKVVVGVRDLGSAGFFVWPVAARALGIDYALVTGYVGSTARVLAAVRGEVDVIVQTADSVHAFVRSGELVPLLSLTDEAPDAATSVPGLADFARADAGPESQMAAVSALAAMLQAGRVVMAPPGLAEDLAACLSETVIAILTSEDLRARAREAGLGLEPAGGAEARAGIRWSAEAIKPFVPLVVAAIDHASR